MPPITFSIDALDDTRNLAEAIAAALPTPMPQHAITLALTGTLGTGKTQWARYMCAALQVPTESVTSPSYVLLQLYKSLKGPIYHFDFYRLHNHQQVWELGFDEIQESPCIMLVEWADKFPETLPRDMIQLHFQQTDCSHRQVIITAVGLYSIAMLEATAKRLRICPEIPP